MPRYSIKTGKTKLILTKSNQWVGLKTNKKNDIPDEIVLKSKDHSLLGGFKVVKLDKKESSIDDKLDEVRKNKDITLGTHVYTAQGSKKPMVPTGNIYILFNMETTEKEQLALLEKYHLNIKNRYNENAIMATVTKESANPIKTSMLLDKEKMVKNAEPDLDALLDHYEFIKPNDDLMPHMWHLQNNGIVPDNLQWKLRKGADAKVVDAWLRLGNLGSPNITLAVIDNGIDMSHPDLQGNITKPFDLWTGTSQLMQGDPSFTHGTPCAGVAIGRVSGKGIVGAAPNAKFMPISGTSFSAEATETMFDYCIKNSADVISCSWGSTDPNFQLNTPKSLAIAKATREGRGGKGCVICYAAGNEGLDYVNYYSAHPDVICVSACTSQDEFADYANQGPEVTVCAPSNGDWPITAPRAWWDDGTPGETGNFRWWMDGKSRGDKYQHFGGTSSATPLVAGICALILSANPNLTSKEVKDILIKTADKIGKPSDYDVRGHSNKFGYGKVNADKAVAEALRRKDGSSGVSTSTTTKPTGTSVVKPAVSSGQGLFRFEVSRQPSQGFAVQIGNFAAYGNVLIQVEMLAKKFKQPTLVHINEISGQTVYRVLVGAFSSINEAIAFQKIMENAGVKGFVKDLRELL